MKRILFIPFFLILCSLISCKKHFAYEVKEIDFVNKSDTIIDGVLVDISLPVGIEDFTMCDSLFMFLVDDPSAQLLVYSANDGHLLGRFCGKGRAKYEIIGPTMISGQIFNDSNGSILLPLREQRAAIKMVNITESLKRNRTVVQDVRECNSIYYILLDNDINNTLEFFKADYNYYYKDITEPPYFEIKCNGDEEGKRIDMYPKVMNLEQMSDANLFYHGTLYKHPSRNLVVQPLLGMDYILFMDIDNNKYFAVHQMGSMSFDDYISATYTIGGDESKIMHEGRELPYYFVETFCTESYVMTLYRAGDYCLSFDDEDKACPELIIFDWDGNFIRSVKLSKPVHEFCFDSNSNTMYGLNMAEDVLYRFDLNDVITQSYNSSSVK
jgi:hypothetical protein